MGNHEVGLSGEEYAPPELTVVGSVTELTLTQDKKFGESDGFTFMGNPITNAST